MKYPLYLVAAALFALSASANAEVSTTSSRGSLASPAADDTSISRPHAGGLVGSLLSAFRPRVTQVPDARASFEAWTRFSRQSMTDKQASSDYELRAVLTTAMLSAGAVGLTLMHKSPRAPRVTIKPCRAGAMLGIQGAF